MNETQVTRPVFQSPLLHLCLRSLSFSLVIISPRPLFRHFLATSFDYLPFLSVSHIPTSLFLLLLISNLLPSPPNLACLSPSDQRIAASQLSSRLQYFGQSLSGGQDLTMDGLVDLAVGAQGHALLLR